MKTREILLNITGNLQKDPAFLGRIPTQDIVSCVYIELYGLRQLYSGEHFERLEQALLGLSGELSGAIERGDSKRAAEILGRISDFQDALPDNEISADFIEKANFNKALVKHRNENTTIVLGDSHVNFFSGNEHLSFIPIGGNVNTCEQINGQPFTELHLGPCLAYKSDAAQSSSGFRVKLNWLLERFISPGARILCAMGEVDIRAHVFKQCERQGKSYEEIVEDITKHYINFLLELKSLGFTVGVWGPIASQPDICPITQDYPRVGSEQDRNRATLYFTEKMQKICHENGIGFASLAGEMITNDYRTKMEFLSSDHCHLGQWAFSMAVEKLKSAGGFF